MKTIIIIILLLITGLLCKVYVEQQRDINYYSLLITTCMNGGVLYEQDVDTAYFCQKVSVVKFN